MLEFRISFAVSSGVLEFLISFAVSRALLVPGLRLVFMCMQASIALCQETSENEVVGVLGAAELAGYEDSMLNFESVLQFLGECLNF